MRTDIRTKLVILLAVNVSVFVANTVWFECATVLILLLLQLCSGRGVVSKGCAITYLTFFAMQLSLFPILPHGLSVLLSVPVVQMRKMFPLLIILLWILRTTKVSELIATMTKMHVPKPVTITIAVTLRYFPTIAEEWHSIRDAIHLRPMEMSNPLQRIKKKIEFMAVPMVVSASKTADELSAAAVTRGIENPVKGTCRSYHKLKRIDGLMMSLSILYVVIAIMIRMEAF